MAIIKELLIIILFILNFLNLRIICRDKKEISKLRKEISNLK